ncbi:hypothetical protein H5410_059899 [Solanum commersonii]|uniref:Uncharacterized protein n=1 Tax=Solanum commersonii TaxID=4109 RepID=A0A9J5W3P4_SOLCO|nr:hypothetical protein H5410_059899 [Solanum commersonii]
MCARHILANWSKNWKGVEERKRFWACARSTFEAELRKNLDKLAQLGKDISNDLVNFNPNRWSKARFRTSSKCDIVDNNMVKVLMLGCWVLGTRLSSGIATSQASASSKRSGKQKSHPTQAVATISIFEPSQAIVQSDSDNRKGANNAFKRQRVVGHGVFVSKDGFICAEQERSISRVIKIGAQEKPISSIIVT